MRHFRCWTVACAVMLLVGAVSTDVLAADADLTTARRVAHEAEAKLLAGLHKTVQAEWSNVPLEEVLEALAKSAGVSLWIDRETLSENGISTDGLTIDLHLGETTVWQALHFVLKPDELAWHGGDGVLSITTKVRADEQFVTRTYDVAAMAEVLERQVKKLPLRNRNDIGSWTNGAIGLFRVPESPDLKFDPMLVLPQFSGGVFAPDGLGLFGSGIPVGRTDFSKGEELLGQMLLDIVPTKWEMIDGEGGTITNGRGRLIIRQTFQVHFLIRELLTAVEEFVVRESKSKSVLIARPGYPHEEDAAIFKCLAERKDLDVREMPIEVVFTELARDCRYRLWIDKPALSADGIASDTPVTLRLSGTSLDTVLHKLVEPLALQFVIEEGTLIVTTRAKADEMLTTRVWFTGDIPEARIPSDLQTALQEGTSGKWLDIDGELGEIWSAVPDWIVINQTQSVHREIAEMFDDLRRAAVAPASATTPELELKIYPVSDESAVTHLIETLPALVPGWDAKQGTITRLGRSLAIKQTAAIHERLDELFRALDQAHVKLNPPKPKEEPKPASATK